MKHALLPEEYFDIRDHVGLIYEIHDDFYDEAEGSLCNQWMRHATI